MGVLEIVQLFPRPVRSLGGELAIDAFVHLGRRLPREGEGENGADGNPLPDDEMDESRREDRGLARARARRDHAVALGCGCQSLSSVQFFEVGSVGGRAHGFSDEKCALHIGRTGHDEQPSGVGLTAMKAPSLIMREALSRADAKATLSGWNSPASGRTPPGPNTVTALLSSMDQ